MAAPGWPPIQLCRVPSGDCSRNYPEKFLQVVLEEGGNEEDCIAIDPCLAVNFVYVWYGCANVQWWMSSAMIRFVYRGSL